MQDHGSRVGRQPVHPPWSLPFRYPARATLTGDSGVLADPAILLPRRPLHPPEQRDAERSNRVGGNEVGSSLQKLDTGRPRSRRLGASPRKGVNENAVPPIPRTPPRLLWGRLSRRTFSTHWSSFLFGDQRLQFLPLPNRRSPRVGCCMCAGFTGSVAGGFTAGAFSALRREPSFYQGLGGPLLRLALQGCIASVGGLGREGPDQSRSGCCPL